MNFDIQNPLYFKSSKIARGIMLWLIEEHSNMMQLAITFEGDRWIVFQYSYKLGDSKINKS